MKNDTVLQTVEAAANELFARGDVAGARCIFLDAIARHPDDAALHLKAGVFHLQEGKGDDAVRLLQRATTLAPTLWPAWELFCVALGFLKVIPRDFVLLHHVTRALEIQEIDNSGARNVANDVLVERFGQDPTRSLKGLIDLRTTSLGHATYHMLLSFLVHCRAGTLRMEAALVDLRRAMLQAAAGLTAGDPEGLLIEALSALAIHCFQNEYVFAESDTEQATIAALQEDVQAALAAGRIPAVRIAALAAYRPLLTLGDVVHELPDNAYDPAAQPQLFARMLEVHITQPRTERALRDEIARMAITDETSRRVQQQYEENPYPCWTQPQVTQVELAAARARPVRPARILVAGAGTGRQPLKLARLFPEAEIIALDLSLASLAYGLRQARARGINNVTFLQGDLLNVAALGKTFDLIAATGVLHHMADPVAGLRALRAVLAPGGSMDLALYTVSGRTSVVAGIALRQAWNLTATPPDLRRFRRIVADLPPEHPATPMTQWTDFYATSEIRDLVFHVQEHRMTLPQVAAMIRDAELKLESVDVRPDVRAQFRTLFPDPAAEMMFDAWARFETQNPGVFGSMYRFVVIDARAARERAP